MTKWVALFILLSLVGCIKEFDRGALERQLEGESLQMSETDIDQVVEPRPQLNFPIRIGVYFSLETPRYREYFQTRLWDAEDKRDILSMAEPLKKDGVISDMYEIADLVVPRPDFNTLVRAAGRQGADTILIIKGLSEVNSYVDPLSVLYLTIVGMWIVPASHWDAIFEIHGDLWNVGNVYLYLTVKTMGVGKIRRPIALMDDASNEAVKLAKEDGIMNFRKELNQKIKSLNGN